MTGFEFRETMSGTWTRDGIERPFAFTVRVRQPSLLRYLRERSATIEGHVDASGLASHAVVAGTIVIDPLLGRRIRYEFAFTGDDGRGYRFAGQKDVALRSFVATMTTLPGEIVDERGGPVGTALVKFDPRDLPSFLGSFRPIR